MGSKYPLDRLRAEWSLGTISPEQTIGQLILWQIESQSVRNGLIMELKKHQKALHTYEDEVKRCRMEMKKMAKAIAKLQKALDELPPF